MRPFAVGRSTNLGYVYCWECDPTGGDGSIVIWSDSVERDDVCELCHRPLSRLADQERAS